MTLGFLAFLAMKDIYPYRSIQSLLLVMRLIKLQLHLRFISGLFNQIGLDQCPGLANLLMSGEKLEELMKLTPEQMLLRWVNHQLERAGVSRRIGNFTQDIADRYGHYLTFFCFLSIHPPTPSSEF